MRKISPESTDRHSGWGHGRKIRLNTNEILSEPSLKENFHSCCIIDDDFLIVCLFRAPFTGAESVEKRDSAKNFP